MSLKYNSYRKDRYDRSFFKDKRYLTANEARDIQLEDINMMRHILQSTFGTQFCVEDSLKVSRSAAKVLTVNLDKDSVGTASIEDKPAIGYYKGIPIIVSKDALVAIGDTSGVGTPVLGTSGNNVTITFDTSTAAQHSLVLSIEEQRITGDTGASTSDNIKEPFLRRTNIGESTGEKRRLYYKLNVMPTAHLTSITAVATRTSQLDYYDQMTLIQGTHYALTAVSTITGSNGEDYYVDFQNQGGSYYTPDSTEVDYKFGTLVDNNSVEFTIVNIYASPTAGYVRYELDCPRNAAGTIIVPVINGALASVIFKKREFYVSDDFGVPAGKNFYEIFRFSFTDIVGTIDATASTLIDYRDEISIRSWNHDRNLEISDGGTIDWGIVANRWDWSAQINIQNPIGASNFTIAAGNITIPAAGGVAYVNLDETTGKRSDGGALTMQVDTINNLSDSENVFVVAWRGTDNRLYLRGHGSYTYGTSGLYFGHNLDSTIIASKGASTGVAQSPHNFWGAQRDTITYTSTGSKVACQDNAGQGEIMIGGPVITIGDGQGTAHPLKEWHRRADFEGNTQAVFEDVFDYINSLNIGASTDGCTIFLKPGTYTFASAIQTSGGGHTIDKLRIVGSGANTIITRSANTNIFQANTDNVEFENITFRDDGSGATALLNFDNSYGKVTNCEFVNMGTGAVAISAEGTYHEFCHNFFDGAGAGDWTAITTETPFASNSFFNISENKTGITNYPQYFIISNELIDCIVAHNIVSVGRSLLTYNAGGEVLSGEICNNVIINQYDASYGVIHLGDINYKNNIDIHSNSQKAGTGYFVFATDNNDGDQNPSNINISDNNIISTKGIYFEFDSTAARTLDNLSIVDNNIITSETANASIRILLSGTGLQTFNNIKIENNNIDSANYGIQWSDAGVALSDNLYYNLSISHNKISINNTSDYGINFNSWANASGGNILINYINMSVDDNDIRYTGGAESGFGIYFGFNHQEAASGNNAQYTFTNFSMNDNKIHNVQIPIYFFKFNAFKNSIIFDNFSIDDNKMQGDEEGININLVGNIAAANTVAFRRGSISGNKIESAADTSTEDCVSFIINFSDNVAATIALQNVSINKNEIYFDDDDLRGIYVLVDGLGNQTVTTENVSINKNNIYGNAGLDGIYFDVKFGDTVRNTKICNNNIYINNSNGSCHGIEVALTSSGYPISLIGNTITIVADTDASNASGILVGDFARPIISNNHIYIDSAHDRATIYGITTLNTSLSTINSNFIIINKTSAGGALTIEAINADEYSAINSNNIRIDLDGNDNVADIVTGIDGDARCVIGSNVIYFGNDGADTDHTFKGIDLSQAGDDNCIVNNNGIYIENAAGAGANKHQGWVFNNHGVTVGIAQGNICLNNNIANVDPTESTAPADDHNIETT